MAAQLTGWLILFSTARRSNGFAGLHDLASRTRVVRVFDSPTREPLALPPDLVEVRPDAPHVGPYTILETYHARAMPDVSLGYDEILRRRVWIRSQPIGAPAVSPSRRDLARPGRLRWLNGRRTMDECWDAYDAPEGRPFAMVTGGRQSWSAVRFWLFDIARELAEPAADDHRALALDAEHLWITAGGRAVLLDFRCPGLPAPESQMIEPPVRPWSPNDAATFVRRVAAVALNGEHADSRQRAASSHATAGLPLHAHAFLRQLDHGQFPSLAAIAAALGEILGRRAVLTRGRRAVHLALSAAVPAGFLVAAIVSSVIRGRLTGGGIIAPLAASLMIMSSFAVGSAALFRGGFMFQALGIAVVASAGEEASRQRAFLRAITAASPSLLFIVAVLISSAWLGAGALVVMVAGAALAALTPERGLQDRLVGTCLRSR